jgi:telomere length regulation protein
MLVAEVIAQRAGKKLDFGDWNGEDHGKPWARQLRLLLEGCDADAEPLPDGDYDGDVLRDVIKSEPTNVDDKNKKKEEAKREAAAPREVDSDDESLVGYASDGSSRSASPTPSEMEEMEKDPTLGVGKKKIPRPVYLAQLGEMLRSRGGMAPKDEEEEANKMEIALDCAEELIRRKKNYGTELGTIEYDAQARIYGTNLTLAEENAVNIGYGLVGLQDNFDLPNFSEKRQRAVTALVACCPRKAAP